MVDKIIHGCFSAIRKHPIKTALAGLALTTLSLSAPYTDISDRINPYYSPQVAQRVEAHEKNHSQTLTTTDQKYRTIDIALDMSYQIATPLFATIGMLGFLAYTERQMRQEYKK